MKVTKSKKNLSNSMIQSEWKKKDCHVPGSKKMNHYSKGIPTFKNRNLSKTDFHK